MAIVPVTLATSAAVSDKPPHHFENLVRGQRGEAPVSDLNPSRAHQFMGPQLHVDEDDIHARANAEFKKRIEEERQKALLEGHHHSTAP